MKKTLLTVSAVIAFVAANILLTSGQPDVEQAACSSYNPTMKLSGGAAGGYAGDPANSNKNCTNCHAGTAATAAGLTTTNIPLTGYVPGTTYIITTTRSAAGIFDFGFETAAQNASGTDLGTFADIDPAETQIKSKTISTVVHKYVTHTGTSTGGSETRSWSYNWTAPIAGSGDVTFYCATLDTDSGGDTAGDVTHTSTTTVSEDLGASVSQVNTKANVSVYPTVSKGNFTLEVANFGTYSVEIYNLTGEKVYEKNSAASVEHININVKSGLYFVNIKNDSKNIIKKVVIQ